MLQVLVDPDRFFSKKKDMGILVPICIVLISGLLGSLLIYTNLPIIEENILRHLPPSVNEEQIKMMLRLVENIMVISPIVGMFISWIILSLAIYFTSWLFGGKGEFYPLFKLTAFGFLPGIVLYPINYYLVATLHTLQAFPIYVVSLASTLWQIYILTFVVKNTRDLDTSRSLLSVALATLIVIILGFVGKIFNKTL